ncbi:hypothetical protein PIB30_035413 [Stylosanthes scabra]|uniref:Uncharacterized protein n=1 Tax=Stylosanthes scabra TaxID=79078 RepID=A0ABU6QCI9_9FABA|nr:hypothetical protein [Stylosanthes scabra]
MSGINHHTTVSNLIHPIILHSALTKLCASTRKKIRKLRKYREEQQADSQVVRNDTRYHQSTNSNSDDEEGESEVESDEEYNDKCGEDKVGSEEENEEDSDEDDDDESEEEEENEDWLYNLLVELYEAQAREKENGNSNSEGESDIEDEIEDDETDDQYDKPFFIATLFDNKRVKEKIPAKCEDPGPCLVTCKMKHAIVRECLCDPGACSSVIPYELYKVMRLGPLKKTEEIFTNANTSVVSVVGIAENVKVRI